MYALLVNCTALIMMIHVFRALGRLAGPRWSGMVLGLPSTTAIVLIHCGCTQGSGPAIAMTESSQLGLVAAVALPLAYAWTVAWSWRLPAALAASVLAYGGIASFLGCLPPIGAWARLGIALSALVCAACTANAIPRSVPEQRRRATSLSWTQTIALRTALPVVYMAFLVIAQRLAGPAWAGLGSTFPSMSLAVLWVTHLEAGPGEASRIARVLPVGNLSTLAFLAAFGFSCSRISVGGGMLVGYAAALVALLTIEATTRRLQIVGGRTVGIGQTRQPEIVAWRIVNRPGPRRVPARTRTDAHVHQTRRLLIGKRPTCRGCFLPLVEPLGW
jgi:hypothetical protein